MREGCTFLRDAPAFCLRMRNPNHLRYLGTVLYHLGNTIFSQIRGILQTAIVCTLSAYKSGLECRVHRAGIRQVTYAGCHSALEISGLRRLNGKRT